jgi:hypothetical protein
MSTDVLVDRLIEHITEFCSGNHQSVIDWLVSLGCQLRRADPTQGLWTFRGLTGTGLSLLRGADPITVAVCIGFLLAGEQWPNVYPSLLDKTSRAWRRALQERN